MQKTSETLPDPVPPAEKRVHIKSFGCQMNVHDAERMADLLALQGYATTDDVEAADLIVLNTCHIREKASEKVYSELGRLRQLKDERRQQGQSTLIAVAGCVAQAEGAEIMKRQPAVDLVVGPQSYQNLPGLLADIGKRRVVDTEFPAEDKFASLPPPQARRLAAKGPAAFLTVQEGCDKFCSFCVVPFTRGAEVSRPLAAIITEAEGMVAAGIREIMLLGQNVNAYHGEGPDGDPISLAGLMEALSRIAGLDRLRYATSHPLDMTADLYAIHRDNPKVMPYLHLPVQSGSNRILKAMNRKHDRDQYRRIIDRCAKPDLISPSPRISSSAFPARPNVTSRTRWISCARSASRRPTRSNTARARAQNPQRGLIRCRKPRNRRACMHCRPCWLHSRQRSTGQPLARSRMFCSRSLAGIPASSPANHPGCRPCISTFRPI